MPKRKYRKKLNLPGGYPFALFEVAQTGSEKKLRAKYVVAATEEQAIRKANVEEARAFPVSVKALTDRLGHDAVHKIFAEHGYSWICKEGKVFFKENTI